MPNAYRIRRAGPADAQTLADLGRETFLETFVEEFKIPYPPEDLERFMAHGYTAGFNADRLTDPAQAVWIAERGDGPVAYAAAGPATLPHPDLCSEDGELRALYVLRRAQSLGLGRNLLDVALTWLEQDGPRRLWLGVWSGNTRALRFYARHGFAKAGEYDFPVGAWRDREFILRRDPDVPAGQPPA